MNYLFEFLSKLKISKLMYHKNTLYNIMFIYNTQNANTFYTCFYFLLPLYFLNTHFTYFVREQLNYILVLLEYNAIYTNKLKRSIIIYFYK